MNLKSLKGYTARFKNARMQRVKKETNNVGKFEIKKFKVKPKK